MFAPAPRKKYGQHFLQDPKIAQKIVALAHLPPRARVLEIGPGRGLLTRALLTHSDATMLAIEKDQGLRPLLDPLQAEADQHHAGRLTISYEDALRWQPPADSLTRPWDIIANLPYNIASQLLVHFCEQHQHYRQMVLMFQKEVANRLVAAPQQKSYGRLSILVQTIGRAEILFSLPPGAFFPPPKVQSSVVRITPHGTEPPCDLTLLGAVTAMLFQQRRKQLHHGLALFIQQRQQGEKSTAKVSAISRDLAKEMMAQLNIAPHSRAEELPPARLWQLTNHLMARGYHHKDL